MPNLVLNVGAGFLPLVASDFENVARLINFDILVIKDELDRAVKSRLTVLVKQLPDVEYVTSRDQVDQLLGTDKVNLALGVSPYGFSLVDEWLNSKVIDNGYVVAIGNEKNKYITDNLFAGDVMSIYNSRTPHPGCWEFNLAAKIRQNYASQVTAMARSAGTELNKTVFWQKGRRTGLL